LVGGGAAAAVVRVMLSSLNPTPYTQAAVDCIMLSFLHDSEVNDGKGKPYFMADSLQQAIGVSNQVTPSG